jgi:hypothetical protein
MYYAQQIPWLGSKFRKKYCIIKQFQNTVLWREKTEIKQKREETDKIGFACYKTQVLIWPASSHTNLHYFPPEK